MVAWVALPGAEVADHPQTLARAICKLLLQDEQQPRVPRQVDFLYYAELEQAIPLGAQRVVLVPAVSIDLPVLLTLFLLWRQCSMGMRVKALLLAW